jgi:hypothetical protein
MHAVMDRMSGRGGHASSLIFLMLISLSFSTLYSQEIEYKWRYPTGGQIIGRAAVSGEEQIYVLSSDKYLYSFLEDGTPLWRHFLDLRPKEGPVVGSTGQVFIVSVDGMLVSISPSGSENWRFSLEFPPIASPIVSKAGLILVAGRNKLYGLSLEGELLFADRLPASTVGSPIFDRGQIYLPVEDVTTDNHRLYALGALGIEHWNVSIPSTILSIGLARNGDPLILGGDSRLYRFNQFDGKLMQVLSLPETMNTVLTGLNQYILANSRLIISLDTQFNVKWYQRVSGGINDLMLGAKDDLYILSATRQITQLDNKGRRIFQEAFDNVDFSLINAAWDDVILISGRDWRIYAFSAGFNIDTAWAHGTGNDANTRIWVDTTSLPWVERYSTSGDFRYMESLMSMGDAQSLEQLLDLLENDNSPFGIYFAEQLARQGLQLGISRIKPFSHGLTRARAYDLLGNYGQYRSLDLLISLANAEWDEYAMSRAFLAMGKIGRDKDGRVARLGLKYLKETVQPDPRVVDSILESVSQVIGFYGGFRFSEEFEVFIEVLHGRHIDANRKKALDFLQSFDV